MADTLEDRVARLERDNVEIRRELSTASGQFEFISGQLRSVQSYMHTKFEQIDARFEQVDARFDRLENRLSKEAADLRRDFPRMAADAMREVLAERDRSGRG